MQMWKGSSVRLNHQRLFGSCIDLHQRGWFRVTFNTEPNYWYRKPKWLHHSGSWQSINSFSVCGDVNSGKLALSSTSEQVELWMFLFVIARDLPKGLLITDKNFLACLCCISNKVLSNSIPCFETKDSHFVFWLKFCSIYRLCAKQCANAY